MFKVYEATAIANLCCTFSLGHSTTKRKSHLYFIEVTKLSTFELYQRRKKYTETFQFCNAVTTKELEQINKDGACTKLVYERQ